MTLPAIVDQEHDAVDGPGLYSHDIQIQFPEVFVSCDLHFALLDHIIPRVFVLSVFDDFKWREQLVCAVEYTTGLLNFWELFAFGL